LGHSDSGTPNYGQLGAINIWFKTFILPIIKGLLIEPKKNKKTGYIIVNDIFKLLG